MTTAEARAHIDAWAAAHRAAGNHDRAAEIELAREYFTNPEFRAALAAHVWKLNQE